jgi:hypothetical protein
VKPKTGRLASQAPRMKKQVMANQHMQDRTPIWVGDILYAGVGVVVGGGLVGMGESLVGEDEVFSLVGEGVWVGVDWDGEGGEDCLVSWGTSTKNIRTHTQKPHHITAIIQPGLVSPLKIEFLKPTLYKRPPAKGPRLIPSP